MNKQRSTVGLVFAIVLLLVPVLYLGSYLALVNPQPPSFPSFLPREEVPGPIPGFQACPYRYGGVWAERIFWPLEQIDRKLRPGTWFSD